MKDEDFERFLPDTLPAELRPEWPSNLRQAYQATVRNWVDTPIEPLSLAFDQNSRALHSRAFLVPYPWTIDLIGRVFTELPETPENLQLLTILVCAHQPVSIFSDREVTTRIERFQATFGDRPQFLHARALLAHRSALSIEDVMRVCRLAAETVELLPEWLEPRDLFVDAFVRLDGLLLNVAPDERAEFERGSEFTDLLEAAKLSQDRRIQMTTEHVGGKVGRADQRARLARLLAVGRDYDAALTELAEATAKRSAEAVSGEPADPFADIRTSIAASRDLWNLERKSAEVRAEVVELRDAAKHVTEEVTRLENLQEEFGHVRGEMITLLGVLAAVIALVTGSITISTQVESTSAAISLLSATGLIVLTIFMAFAITLGRVRWPGRAKAWALVGTVILLVGGVVLPHLV